MSDIALHVVEKLLAEATEQVDELYGKGSVSKIARYHSKASHRLEKSAKDDWGKAAAMHSGILADRSEKKLARARQHKASWYRAATIAGYLKDKKRDPESAKVHEDVDIDEARGRTRGLGKPYRNWTASFHDGAGNRKSVEVMAYNRQDAHFKAKRLTPPDGYPHFKSVTPPLRRD